MKCLLCGKSIKCALCEGYFPGEEMSKFIFTEGGREWNVCSRCKRIIKRERKRMAAITHRLLHTRHTVV